ncbi:MAG: hypothetical protein ABR936_16485 [Bacteroidota bacterium]|jgi:hypothetical protein
MNKPYNYIWIATSFVFIFGLLIFVTAFYPAGWNWGFHFLAFYRLEIIIIIPLLMLLFTIPSVQEFLINRIFFFTQWFSRQHRIIRIAITLIALGGFVIVFWIFRARSYFLGDGQLILRSLQNFNSADELDLAYKREPLIGFCIVFLESISKMKK